MTLWQHYTPEMLTDLYELTMAGSYLQEGMDAQATFSLFVRNYPRNRGYFVSAGVEHLVEMLSGMRFSEESLAYIASLRQIPRPLLDYLRTFRFTGEVRAIPEGRIYFTDEPIIEVTAPIIQAQIIETLVINTIQTESLIASKAARCFDAARGVRLIDFSFRRTQGVDAGVKVARASYLAGFLGTSNMLAGKLYGIPVFGTMAHSYITSFDHEMDAFLAFAKTYPDTTLLLIDTYDTISGAHKAVAVARHLEAQGKKLLGVRLDSGDLAALSKQVRQVLRDSGFPDIRIMVSGSLDEFALRDLIRKGAEFDMAAVGTKMGVSADAPYFDMAYKLVEYAGRPALKLSSGKKTWVGRKQTRRFYDSQGYMDHDVLGLISERHADGEPLLETVIQNGEPLRSPESLETIRGRFAKEIQLLHPDYRDIESSRTYPVAISAELREAEARAAAQVEAAEIQHPGPGF